MCFYCKFIFTNHFSQSFIKVLTSVLWQICKKTRTVLCELRKHFWKYLLKTALKSSVCLCFRHQAGWFPFRPEQQNLRGGGRVPQEEAERHQDMQEMVSWALSVTVFLPYFSSLLFSKTNIN